MMDRGVCGAPGSRCNVSVVGQQSSVTVNNGSGGRQVLITPLSSVHVQHQAPSSITHRQRHVVTAPLATPTSTVASKGTLPPSGQHFIGKALLKAVCQSAKKDPPRAFTLRGIDTTKVLSCDDLKTIIRRQLQHDIRSDDFDVGYIQGSSVVRVRSKDDINEMWIDLSKPNSKTALWCDGLKEPCSMAKPRESCKRKQSEDNSDDEESTRSARKKKQPSRKEEEVQELVDILKEKHTSTYTQMQYRIWAELIAGGLHVSTDDPPNNSMFIRAGGGTPYRKNVQSPVAQLLTEAATAITSALSSKPTPLPSSGTSTSPAKLIESRSKLYKQLSELQNLRTTGILTESEYCTEKATIMELLRKLKANA